MQNMYEVMKVHGGRIINIGSVAEHYNLVGNSAYASTKSALKTLSHIAGEEWKSDKIRSTYVMLGPTQSSDWSRKDEENTSSERYSLLSTSEVAEVVLWVSTLPLTVRMDEISVTPENHQYVLESK
jgi:NADP-dependent 3-hydroxy acid dehydrogenase YdfG